MKIAILSRIPTLYSSVRLMEAAQARGHQARVLDPTHCYMNITAMKPSIQYQGEPLNDYDAVIPRIGASITFYGLAVLRQFEVMNTFCLNNAAGISRSRDKLASSQLLARKGIDLPITAFAHNPDNIDDLIAEVGGAPLVIKMVEGSQGIGVVLAETDNAARSVIQAFMGLNANIMVQEFIREAAGSDIRCFVIGDKVVAAMKRQSREGEFRSNLHRGGSATAVKLTAQERAMALRAAKAIGLDVCGVDLLRTKRGPLIMEVNSSPGLEGIEQACDMDIAGLMIEFIEKNLNSALKNRSP